MKLSFWKILKITLQGKTTKMFFVLTVLSLSFSMAVILCNIGLMDGYEEILKSGLRQNTSDLEIQSSAGFFETNNEFLDLLNQAEIQNFSGVIRTEGFLVHNSKSKGVLIYGVEPSEFSKTSSLNLDLDSSKDGIIIGSEIAKDFKVKKGDSIIITFARGNKSMEEMPYVTEIPVLDVVKHGVYQKDSRLVYVHRTYLEEFTNSQGLVNSVLVKLDQFNDQEIESFVKKQEMNFFEYGFELRPYWSDFKSLFEAVEIEKFSITIILQLIVLIALFNIAAFINFNAIKKSQEFFLLRSLGLSFKSLYSFWARFIVLIWLLSCILSLFFTLVFDKIILKLPMFKIPSKVYELDSLGLSISFKSIVLVFLLTLFWSVISIFYIVTREKKKTILEGIKGQYV